MIPFPRLVEHTLVSMADVLNELPLRKAKQSNSEALQKHIIQTVIINALVTKNQNALLDPELMHLASVCVTGSTRNLMTMCKLNVNLVASITELSSNSSKLTRVRVAQAQ